MIYFIAYYYFLRLIIFVQWLVHQNADQRLYFDLMPKLKAVTSASNVVKLLKIKSCISYKSNHVPND